ncbi:HAD-IA family hydrolase [Hydrocarboniphaga sp.]|uniref:HAD-IA family hydrolase n=1 Tax=Hydrocarboniphaga sp. TaxID=2033016 RepID=UPI003D09BDED
MYELILFDLDGTLVDTAGDICDTANDVLLELGLAAVDEALARTWIGQGSRELMIRAYAHASGLSETALRAGSGVDCLMDLFTRFHAQRCGKRSTVYPQVRESLAALRDIGVRMAVLTNREMRFARLVLERHELQDYFDPVIAGDTLPAKKPDALPVEYCLREHGVDRNKALLIGDSAVDIATGRNAGIRCWVVPYGYNGGRAVIEDAPDRMIADFSWIVAAMRDSQCGLSNRPKPSKELLSWR